MTLEERLNEWATPQRIEQLREHCLVTTATHGAMGTIALLSHNIIIGFAFGGLFGLFMAGLASPTSPELNLANPDAPTIPLRQQMKQMGMDMGKRTWASAKSLGKIALIYSLVECSVESYRAKHDIWNTGIAGAVTGGLLAARSGPRAMAVGAAGFAAFSLAIDHFFQDRY